MDCPQPPEVKIGISPIHGYVPGYLSNEPIPFVNGGSNITITTRQDNVGQPNVAFIVRPKTNNGLDSGENNSSGNAFNASEIVTSPCTGSSIPCTTSTTYTSIPGPSNPYWDTSKPGLYGIDAYAVDKNNKYQSKMDHFPFIIAPGSLETHRLIFNIKDSYYADLYGTSGTPTEIYKQVELNGHKIWQEDIAIGGDDWEYVIIDLFDPAFAPFLDTRNFKNTITFSIAIANKCSTSSVDHRGLRVWVDDVYLQGKDGVENLMKDGSIENSTASGLTTSPTNESLWYIINHSKFTGCFSLDSKYPLIPASAEPAGTEATIAFNERRSGSKSIEIKLDGIHDTNFGSISCNTYCDLTVDDPAPSPLYPDVFISAGFDFDFRDFIDCNALGSSLLSNPYEEFPVSPLDPDYTDKNFIITSNITISSDLQLIGCQLAIEPHDPPYSITIPNNITLELLASSINSTKLFGCSEMWGGIIVQSGGLLNIEGVNARPTEIHDALTGVYNNEGTTFARYAIFDHNYIGMRFENGSHFNASPLTTEGISATEFRCSNGEIKLPPYAGEPSNTHILLENVDEIRIGGINAPNPGGLTNSFTDAVYGIRSINSSFSLYNSEIDRMQNFSDVHPCFTCGAGIYAENTTSGSFEMNIGTKNGLTSTFLKNTFKNCKIGIFTKGNFVLDCDENNFGDLVTGIRSNRNNSSITIHDNNFERVSNGVIVFNSRGNMKINDNTFTTSAGLPPGISFNNTAITIQNPISRFINQEVSVFGNTITDYRIGIHAINIPSPGIGFDIGTNTIAGNEIIYNINNFPLTEYHGGIWLQNCPQARIFDNIISNADFNADDNFRGIDIWSSVLTDVNCNDITNLGVGISFFDDCRNSQLRSNVITEFNRGVWLNGINGQGMINLVQGVQGTQYSAWDNKWIFIDPANNTGQFKVDGFVIGNQPINWYHQGADSPGITWSPNPWNGSMVNPFPSQNSASPSCVDVLRWAGESRIANFGPVVGDSATYGEYSDHLRYLARNATYKIMKIDTSIINVGDSSDVYFEAFYNQLDTTNSGVFHKIQSLIETIPDSALILIDAMVPENELEEKLLAFYQIYFDALYADDNMSATDSAEVLEWTQGNLALSGEVFFNSLASMFEEKHPVLISLRSSGTPSNSAENSLVYSNDNVEVFPNPANQSVTVKLANASSVITKIQVINSIGKVVATYAPDNSTYLLNLKGIAPGLYFLKIYCLDSEHNKKIQIIR